MERWLQTAIAAASDASHGSSASVMPAVPPKLAVTAVPPVSTACGRLACCFPRQILSPELLLPLYPQQSWPQPPLPLSCRHGTGLSTEEEALPLGRAGFNFHTDFAFVTYLPATFPVCMDHPLPPHRRHFVTSLWHEPSKNSRAVVNVPRVANVMASSSGLLTGHPRGCRPNGDLL